MNTRFTNKCSPRRFVIHDHHGVPNLFWLVGSQIWIWPLGHNFSRQLGPPHGHCRRVVSSQLSLPGHEDGQVRCVPQLNQVENQVDWM